MQPAQGPSQATQGLAQAEAICRGHSARLTPIRKRVLETLYMSEKPLGAYELADRLAPLGRRMAPITVYRALDFLIEQGLAYRIASLNAYVASRDRSNEREAAMLLICQECGSVSEVMSSEVSNVLTDLVRQHTFKPRAKAFEITGRCAHCESTRSLLR